MLKEEKLQTRCDNCQHQAAAHAKEGKHECLNILCTCQWFKMPPKEKTDATGDLLQSSTDSAS